MKVTFNISDFDKDKDSKTLTVNVPADLADQFQSFDQTLQAKAAKRYPDAIVSFRRAVESRPDYPEAWNELGFALRQTGKYDDALGAYDQALKLRPNFPEALEYLGETYVKLGRLADARAILERLTPLDAARAKELDEAIRVGH